VNFNEIISVAAFTHKSLKSSRLPDQILELSVLLPTQPVSGQLRHDFRGERATGTGAAIYHRRVHAHPGHDHAADFSVCRGHVCDQGGVEGAEGCTFQMHV